MFKRLARHLYVLIARILRSTWLYRTRICQRLLTSTPFMALRRVLAPPRSAPVLVHGHRMFFPQTSFPEFFMFTGQHEKETVQLLIQLLKTRMGVVDVGAHVGYHTLLSARLVGPQGRVYAFEPHPENYELLVKNIQLNGYHNVTAVRKAVSNRNGTVALFISKNTQRHSLYSSDQISGETIAVESIALDTFFEAEGWPPINLVKIDIEGGEVASLEGMTGLIRRNPQLKLIIEFNPGCLQAANVTPEKFFTALRAKGFTRFHVIDRKLELIEGPQDACRVVRRSVVGWTNLLCEHG